MKKLKIGDKFEITIEKIGRRGDGIAHFDDYIFLILDTNEGEKVRIEVIKASNNFAFGKVIERIK